MDANPTTSEPRRVARRWDPQQFAFLIRSLVDAPTVAVLDEGGRSLFRVGEPVDLSGAISDLVALTPSAMHVRSDWPAERLGSRVPVGDWLVYERVGDRSQQFLLVVGSGETPTGETAAALEMVLSGTQERRDLIDEISDMGERMRQQAASSILACITRAQSDFILDGDARGVFAHLLEDILELTGSEYGFIGEVDAGTDGPLLRTWAITNIAWTDELHEWFEQNDPQGIEFTNLETLFGAVIGTGEPVVANMPQTDPRRGGLPEGHPPLDAFLGLPFVRGDEMVGMVGLANRPGGYDDDLITFLEPFLTTCAALIESLRGSRTRDEAERQLRVSEARTRAILESVGDAVVVIDERGLIETFNQAAEQTFGYAAADVIGGNVSILMPSEVASAHDGYLHRYADEADQRIIGRQREVVGRRSDGSTFPLELTVSEVEVEGRRLFAGTCRDLTEKMRAERQIRMWAGTIEATPDFVGVSRPNGEVLVVNQAGRAMVGLPQDGPLDTLAVGDVHAPWSRELIQNVGMPAALRDGIWRGETAFITPDGGEIPMSQVIVVSKGADGEAQLISTIARDISELKEVERVKHEFVSTVSHELRTPLTSIRGSLGLLSGGVMGELSPQVDEMIGLAHGNVERLVRLVNDILDFEKAQAGRLDIRLDAIEPLEIGRIALDAVKGVALEAGVALELDIVDAALPLVTGNVDRLVQVLINLLGNAIKFSPAGEAAVLSIHARSVEVVTFEVSDHGPGIASAELESIFEPFHQADSTDRRSVGGTGLGLAIARAIAHAHQGEIMVESSPGEGSTFSLAVPVHEAMPDPVLAPAGNTS